MLGAKLAVGPYLEQVCRAIAAVDAAQVVRLADRVEAAYRDGRTVFIAGNGGSAAIAGAASFEPWATAVTGSDGGAGAAGTAL